MTQPTHDALLAGLAVKTAELNQSTRELKAVTEKAADAFRLSRLLKAVLVTCLVLIGGLVAMSILLLKVSNENHTNGQLVRDCTIPAGKCYQRSLARTGSAVGLIDRTIVIAFECSRVTGTDQAFVACVKARLSP